MHVFLTPEENYPEIQKYITLVPLALIIVFICIYTFNYLVFLDNFMSVSQGGHLTLVMNSDNICTSIMYSKQIFTFADGLHMHELLVFFF